MEDSMSDTLPVPPPPPVAIDRMTKLEARVAALELKLTSCVTTTDSSIRTLKREVLAVSRAMANRRGD
jgi:hypothetical protein